MFKSVAAAVWGLGNLFSHDEPELVVFSVHKFKILVYGLL